MKCPNCGKKMKKETCTKCGYNPTAKVETPVAVEVPAVQQVTVTPVKAATPTYAQKVNYYTYDPANPNVWYPVTTNAQGQPNFMQTSTSQVQIMPAVTPAPVVAASAPIQATPAPVATAPAVVESAVPTSKKAAKKAAKAAKKEAKKAAKTAGKKATKQTKKADKKVASASKKANKKAAAASKKANKKAAKSNTLTVETNVSERKNIASRLFALVIIGLCACTFAVFKLTAVRGVAAQGKQSIVKLQTGEFYAFCIDMFKTDAKLFSVLPAIYNGDNGMFYNIAFYAFALCGVIALLHAVFAIFSKAKAPRRVRRALFFLGVGALVYTVAMALLLTNYTLTNTQLAQIAMLNVVGYYLDIYTLAIGGGCLLLSLLFLIFKRKNKAK